MAKDQFRTGERIDISAIATTFGMSRATVYRWFGSRRGLIEEVLLGEFQEMAGRAVARAAGTGAKRLLSLLDGFNRQLLASSALLAFIRHDPEGLSIITSETGLVQPTVVAVLRAEIERSVTEDGYRPRVDPPTLAYALVRLAEVFMYDDAVTGIRGEHERFHEVAAALLGVDT